MADRVEYAGIDHVQLAMPAGRDADARRFYAGVLGLTEVAKPPALAARGGCWFVDRTDAVHVHLGVERDFRPAMKAHPAFAVRDLEGLRGRLAEAGAGVTDDYSIPGVHRFYTADPFGNRLEFVAEADRGFTPAEGAAGPR